MPGNVIPNIPIDKTPAATIAAGALIDNCLESYCLSGMPCGYKFIDDVVSGWLPGDLIAIAGFSNTGKSTFALDLAYRAKKNDGTNAKTLYISSQHSERQLILDLLRKTIGGDFDFFKRDKITEEDKALIMTELGRQPLPDIDFCTDTKLTLKSIIDTIGDKLEQGIEPDLIIIDSFKDITPPPEYNGNRIDELDALSRHLKSLARELELPIIIVTEAPRGNDKYHRSNRVTLENIGAFNGSIDCESDVIISIYQHDYRGLSDDQLDYYNPEVEFEIIKNRRGPTTSKKLRFNTTDRKFEEIDESYLEFLSSSMNEFETEDETDFE